MSLLHTVEQRLWNELHQQGIFALFYTNHNSIDLKFDNKEDLNLFLITTTIEDNLTKIKQLDDLLVKINVYF
jgi:hypothetical protein